MLESTNPVHARERLSPLGIDPATWRQIPAPPASLPCPSSRNGTASLSAKRCFDVVTAVGLLACLAPLLLAIAVLVRLDSPGPALFRQRRSGCGASFRIVKFRTMHAQFADESGLFQTRRGDRRITAIGGYLRRTSLDELPQLFNVLAGDMSMVGPRPHAPGTRAAGRELEDVDPRYPLRHRVRPGITGLAQISACRGELDSEAKLRRRIDFDLIYIGQRTMAMDLRILWLTLWMLHADPDAY